MTNKVKIGFDLTMKNSLQSQVNNGLASINTELKPALGEIGFELTAETLQDCYSGCKATLRNYFERLDKDLAAIATPSSRAVLQKSAGTAFENFNAIVGKALNKVWVAAREYISVENGFAVLNEESKAKLEDACTIYLSDSEEIELYRLHCAAAEALNAFLQRYKSPDLNMLYEWQNGQFAPALLDYYFINQRIKQLKIN
jgi:hypothetical protein